jgi:uncharacterized membrane protein required for colicin V production
MVLALAVLFAFIGYKRGLVRSVLHTGAAIITLVLAYFLAPLLSNFLQQRTKLDDYIEDKLYALVEQKVTETVDGSVGNVKKTMEQNPDKQDQVSLIRSLGIPDFILDHLLSNNNAEGYKALGVNNVYRYIARSGTVVAMNLIAGIISYIVIRLLLLILSYVIRTAVQSFVILRIVDKIGGAAAGVVLSVVIIWMFMFVLSLLLKSDYTKLVQENGMLKMIDGWNPLTKLALK